MKILIVTQYFWPESFRINDLALGLSDRGHDVTVLTGKPNYPTGRFFAGYGFFSHGHDLYKGIPVIRAPLIPRGNGSRVRLVLNYISFAFIASVYAAVRYRDKFDVTLVYAPSPITAALPALLYKMLRRTPTMIWVQDLWPESLAATGAIRAAWLLRPVAILARYIYKYCDLVLVQSRQFAEPIRRLGVDANRVRYFPNSAEELYRPIDPGSCIPERESLPSGFRVMFAGNIGAAQDFETILAAAERLKSYSHIKWTIVGDGRLLPWVITEIKRRGLGETVCLLGIHPVETMPRFFALADVMLVTLKKHPVFSLTIPAKMQSYLACAKLIVAALDGEAARVVQDSGAGVAVEAGNADALADAILMVSHMPSTEREMMGKSGHRYFKAHFERNQLLAQLENWMSELMVKQRRCAS